MEFKKLDNDKIKCLITRQEMEEQGIDIGDFLGDQTKSRAFIKGVIEEAQRTFNLSPAGHSYSVQMTLMPHGDLSLIISPENTDSLESAIDMLKEKLTELQEVVKERASNPSEKVLEKAANKSYRTTPLWSVFHDISTIKKMTLNLESEGLHSKLYRYDDEYYVSMLFDMEEMKASNLVLTVCEYADAVFTEEFDGAFLTEHGDLILDDCISFFKMM